MLHTIKDDLSLKTFIFVESVQYKHFICHFRIKVRFDKFRDFKKNLSSYSQGNHLPHLLQERTLVIFHSIEAKPRYSILTKGMRHFYKQSLV